MAFIAGKDSAITIDGTALTSYVDSMSLSRDINTLTVTSFGDDNEAYIAGVSGFSIDISGSFDATADSAIAGMFDGAVVAFDFRPNDTSGAPKYTGNALITNYTIDSSAGDKVSFSASILLALNQPSMTLPRTRIRVQEPPTLTPETPELRPETWSQGGATQCVDQDQSR